MRRTPILMALCGVMLSGCVPHRDQTGVFVATVPPGASCTVSRDGAPVASVAPTPGIAMVGPGGADVLIQCQREGFLDASTVAQTRRRDVDLDLFNSEVKYDYPPVTLPLTPRR